MKTIIIAMPVPDDTDIFEITDAMNAAFPPASDAADCVVYESANALADDLGWEVS